VTFWDHLEELRRAVLRSLLCLCVCSCFGLIFKEFLFDKVIFAPLHGDFPIYRILGRRLSISLVNIELSAQFLTHLKASLSVGLILSFPFIVWEVWKFVSPALFSSERKPLGKAFLLSSGLFYVGIAVGYFVVLPVCLQFFSTYSISSDITNAVSLNSYMSMFLSMVLLVGIMFEFPTAVLALSSLQIIDRQILRHGRKYAFVLILILSAIITPTDPFSMFVLALPLYGLYELSILLCSSSPKTDTLSSL